MTFDIEDDYLDLLVEVGARSEYAVAARGVRNDLDTAAWSLAVVSGAISGLAGGMLAAWGEDLAHASSQLVRRIAKRRGSETNSSQQVNDLETLHRVVVEVKNRPALPASVDDEIIEALKRAGLDDESARSVARRLRDIVNSNPADG